VRSNLLRMLLREILERRLRCFRRAGARIGKRSPCDVVAFLSEKGIGHIGQSGLEDDPPLLVATSIPGSTHPNGKARVAALMSRSARPCGRPHSRSHNQNAARAEDLAWGLNPGSLFLFRRTTELYRMTGSKDLEGADEQPPHARVFSIAKCDSTGCALDSELAKGSALDIPVWVATITAQFAVVVGRVQPIPRPAESADRGYQCETGTKFTFRRT
jgi:hypothetical protein